MPPSGVLSEAEEAAVSRSLELVRFLLENFHSVCHVPNLPYLRAEGVNKLPHNKLLI